MPIHNHCSKHNKFYHYITSSPTPKHNSFTLHNTWTTNQQRGIDHDHDLHHGHNYYIPLARTEHVKRLTYFALPTTWNELPDDKLTPNKTTFKTALKNHLWSLETEHTD